MKEKPEEQQKAAERERASLRENPWLTGCTLRDMLAIAITNGLFAGGDWTPGIDDTGRAQEVWALADIIVANREGGAKKDEEEKE